MLAPADGGVDGRAGVVGRLSGELLAVVLGDVVGGLGAVHAEVVPEGPVAVVEVDVEGASAEARDARSGPDVVDGGVERGGPDDGERLLLHDLLGGGVALVVVGRRGRAVSDDALDHDLAAVQLVVLVDELHELADGIHVDLFVDREALGGEDGVHLLVGLRAEVDDLDLLVGDALLGGAAVVAGELRLAGRGDSQAADLLAVLAVAGVAGGLPAGRAAGPAAAGGATAVPPAVPPVVPPSVIEPSVMVPSVAIGDAVAIEVAGPPHPAGRRRPTGPRSPPAMAPPR